MPDDLESVYEQARSNEAAREREHEAAMSTLAARRRERRKKWPARLRFRPHAEGGELIVRAMHKQRVTLLLGTVGLALGYGSIFVFGRSPFMDALPYVSVHLAASLVGFWALRREFCSQRILLMPGGRYVRQERDWFGRLIESPFGRAHGKIPRVEFDYDWDEALLTLEWDGYEFRSMSEADVATAQRACASVGIQVIHASDERRNEIDHRPPDTRGEWIWKFGLTVWVVSTVYVCSEVRDAMPRSEDTDTTTQSAATIQPPMPQRLEGSFHSQNRTLGAWTLTPERCVSGRELGFEGIAFMFPAGSPVTELRIEAGASSENYAEWRFADPSRKPYRMLRSDCVRMGGKISAREVPAPSGRSLQQLTGNLELDCPKKKVQATASFDGCLPPP